MELENLNLVELNVVELEETTGGNIPGIGWWMDVAFSYGSGSGGICSRQKFYDTYLRTSEALM